MNAAGTASGNITGIDGTTPYSVFWPGSAGSTQNASLSYAYTATCQGSTPTTNGVTLTQATITMTGAQIVYNGQASGATVAVDFGATTIQDTLLVSVSAVRISWGSSLITIAPPTASGGVLQMIPTVPAGGCLNSNTQGYAISGTLVTVSPV
ncbi:MAG TPA: hypothetical protein VGQ42_01260 [Candidatus Dormibacteraeota bacterium]|nr:hypothetical protein [Candidatus Dormibacteraeota bacterium]